MVIYIHIQSEREIERDRMYVIFIRFDTVKYDMESFHSGESRTN